jgi:hypothetical protein
MISRCLLLFGAVGSILAAGSMPKAMPDAGIQTRLVAMIQARFANVSTDKFGISRLGEPFNTHQPAYRASHGVRPENVVESKILEDLKAGGWETAVYTTGAKPDRYGVHGPVFFTGVPSHPAGLPSAGMLNEDFLSKVRKLTTGKATTVTFKDWAMVSRSVKALDTCTKCHDVKVGERIGSFIMAFRKPK